jgi:membrane associated rhomboid family serine protease
MKFNALAITKYKEFYRLFSYGLIHANWTHLIMNMFTLYFFGGIVEAGFKEIFGPLGGTIYILFYILAIAISSIADLIKHKNDSYYNAVGASGAVSAVLFAAILFYPNMKLFLFFIPIPITAWFFGIIYLAYSYFMAKKNIDNIGHNAHFWGSIFGFFFPILFQPQLFFHFLNNLF